jgi:hypothetical protein
MSQLKCDRLSSRNEYECATGTGTHHLPRFGIGCAFLLNRRFFDNGTALPRTLETLGFSHQVALVPPECSMRKNVKIHATRRAVLRAGAAPAIRNFPYSHNTAIGVEVLIW